MNLGALILTSRVQHLTDSWSTIVGILLNDLYFDWLDWYSINFENLPHFEVWKA